MKYSLPNLEFREFSSVACEGEKLRTLALGILSKTGGVLMGASTILTRHPDLVEPVQTFLLKDENAGFRGLVIADGPFKVEGKITKLVKNNEKSLCQKFDNFEINLADCLIVDKAVFPRDIVVAGTPFAEFARWLFYGRRKAMIVEREESPIPRVTHYVRFQGSRYAKELSFQHYLSVLSALHVAGFTQVFVHGDAEPTGPLWGDLKRENVTFVRLQKPKFVFQNKIEVVEHASDISRYLLLYKFGGVYQDWDVLWVQRFPDSLLSYPAVIGVDMFNYSWPDSLNNGVLAAHARSHFLHHFLATHREYFDTDWGRNSLQMSYRTWELYPMTVVIDRHLHVRHFWLPRT
nr:hypothetical protein BaRGS_006832 [Batillaria attramentaria]